MRLRLIAVLLVAFLFEGACLAVEASSEKPVSSSPVEVSSRLVLSGHAVQGGLMFGRVPAGTTVKLDGRPVLVSKQGRFLMGFGRDHKATARLTLKYADGSSEIRRLAIKKREYKIQRIDGLPKGKVSGFSKADLKRIRSDSKTAKQARALRDRRTDWQQPFIWPVKGVITGVYGSQRILNGKPRRPHFGVDIARPIGTQVVAPAGGVVTLVRDMFFSGNTVIIDHGYGLSSSFLHMNKAYVKVGDLVSQGDVFGEIGATGRVTGPHLDWRMNWLNQRVDPQLLVPPMPAEKAK